MIDGPGARSTIWAGHGHAHCSTLSYDHTFQEDAWRVIANANVDAGWWGVQPWQTAYSNELEQFFASRPGGVTGYMSRYHLDGTPVTNGQNTHEPAHAQGLVAMNSTSAITATRPERLAFVRDLWNTPIPSGQALLRRDAVLPRPALRLGPVPRLAGGLADRPPVS